MNEIITPMTMMLNAVVISTNPDSSIQISLNPTTDGDDSIASYKCGVLSHIPRPFKDDAGIVLCSGLTQTGQICESTTFVWMGKISHMDSELPNNAHMLGTKDGFSVQAKGNEVIVGKKRSYIKVKENEVSCSTGQATMDLSLGSFSLKGTDRNSKTSYRVSLSDDGTGTAYMKKLFAGIENGISFASNSSGSFTFTGEIDKGDFDSAKATGFFGAKAQHIQLRASGPVNISGSGAYFKLGGASLLSGVKTAFSVDSLDGNIILQTGVSGDIKLLANSPTSNIILAFKPGGVSSPTGPELKLSSSGISAKALSLSFDAITEVKISSQMAKLEAKLIELQTNMLNIQATLTTLKGNIKIDGMVGGPTGFCGLPQCLFTGAPHTTPVHNGGA